VAHYGVKDVTDLPPGDLYRIEMATGRNQAPDELGVRLGYRFGR